MSSIQSAQIRQRSATTLATALPKQSVSPSVRSEAKDVQLNQGRIEIQEQGETTRPSRLDNPTFDPTTTAESFSKLAL